MKKLLLSLLDLTTFKKLSNLQSPQKKHKILKTLCFCFFLIAGCPPSIAYSKIDSLLNVLKSTQQDTTKINTINALSEERRNTGDYTQAIEFHFKVLKINEEIGNKQAMAMSHNNIGNLYLEQGTMDKEQGTREKQDLIAKGKKQLLKSLSISKEIKEKPVMMETYLSLATCDSVMGNFKSAYEYHKLYSMVKDSIFNETSSKSIAEMQTRYDSEKKEQQIKTLKKEQQIKILKKETEMQKRILALFISSFAFVLLFFFVVMNRFVMIRKQNKVIEDQRKLVDIKNEELEEAKELTEKLAAIQQAVMNSTDISIISVNPNGTIQSFNKGAEKMLGYTAKEVVGILSSSIFHDNNEIIARAEILTQEFGYKIEPGFDVFHIKNKFQKTDTNEWTYIRKDGSRIPVLLTCSIALNKNGDLIGSMGIAIDITERKAAEIELKKTHELLQSTNTVAKIGNWDYNSLTHELFYMAELYKIFEFERTSKNKILQDFVDKMHPDDREFFNRTFDNALVTGLPYEMEYRIILKNKSVKYVVEIGTPYKNDDGNIIGIQGTVQDISERKIHEFELAKTNLQIHSFF